jgi:sporulation protein YlmC with PRC-barrel domain
MPVIDLTARRLGNVEEIYLDLRAARLSLIDVRAGQGMPSQRIAGARISRVGAHAIMLMGWVHGGLPSLPVDEEWIESENVLGMEVIDDGGDRIGYISDVYLNRDSLAIEAYELETPWYEDALRGPRLIMPGQVYSCSHDLMIAIPDGRTVVEAPVTTIAAERRFRVGWEERTLRVPVQQYPAIETESPAAKTA